MECYFCGREIPKGRGLMFVKADGTTYYFCSDKCKKNSLKLKREGRKSKWTEKFRRFREETKKTGEKEEKSEEKKK
ncbi:MAG: 50S ribosomal protein L24e [Candidatus Anstonellales archaeon]